MKNIERLALFAVVLLGACSPVVPPGAIGKPAGMFETQTPAAPARERRTLPPNVTWQIQYTGKMDYGLDVDVYNLDLFDVSAETVAQLRGRGVFVMCYFNAGAREDWRPDAAQFPDKVIGKEYEGWTGENWLDIRARETLAPIMSARLDLAAQKGCDGVDPDNVNGYENDTGFPLTYNDQLAYNIWLADQAHARGLAVGLKNDLEQVEDLQPFFDWIINESCFAHDECYKLLPFKLAGKPVFIIEYDLNPEEFCFQANDLNFNALQKKPELDEFHVPCR